jgi:predicted transcriptional regulator
VLGLLSIKSPSTLYEISNEKRISCKNMKIHLGFLFNQGLISKTGQGRKLPAVFSLTQLGTNVLIYFKPFQEKIQSESISEEKKWAISKLVVRK